MLENDEIIFSSTGKVDFYFNAGFQQPGCAVDVGTVVKKVLKFDVKDAFLDGECACEDVRMMEKYL